MASFKNSVQLILYPQVYDGYYEFTRPNTTSGGVSPVGNKPPVGVTYEVPIKVPEVLGNAEFSRPIFGESTEIGINASGAIASNAKPLRENEAPIGQWRLAHTTDLASNKPKIEGGVLNLTGSATLGSTSIAYTTVSNLQAGNSYRVLVTINSAPAGKLQLGATGVQKGSWVQDNNANGLARMAQLGGVAGMTEAPEDWVKADTGVNYGNPLRQAISTKTRFYQNFVARNSVEVLQLSYQSVGSTTPILIDEISLVATTSGYPLRRSPNSSNADVPVLTNAHGSTTVDKYLDDGQVILDLYKDQTIPLNLSVDEFTKVDEKIASYSKSFMIPATKHNNKIFSFYFDVTRTQAQDTFFFNPFAKTRAKIKDDTVLIFEGWMRLINVQVKDGQISYNINLFSEPTTFCDFLKVRVLGDLDIDELGHDLAQVQVESSWDDTIGLPLSQPLNTNSFAYDPALGTLNTNVLKYPFINWNGAFELTSPDEVDCGMAQDVFRPVINVKYLLDKMFEATPFTYESNFLSSSYFKKLFMDYNYSGESLPLNSMFVMHNTIKWGDTSTGAWTPLVLPITLREEPTGVSITHYNNGTGEFTMQDDGNLMTASQPRFYRDWFNTQGEVRVILDQTANGGTSSTYHTTGINFNNLSWGAGTPDCSALDGTAAPITLANEQQCGAGRTGSLWLIFAGLQAGDKIRFEFRKTGGGGTLYQSTNEQVGSWKQDFLEDSYDNPEKNAISFLLFGGASTTAFLQQGIRAQMKQYDLWNGIKTMFNLVTLADKTTQNHLIIEPYNDIFLKNPNSKQLDWTEKVDASNIKIEPLNKIPKITHFTYEEDEDDFRVNQYKKALQGYLYGTKTYEAGSQFFSLLTGEKKIEAKPFAPTLTAPLTMLFPDWIVSHIYSAGDEGYKCFANKPRILYDEGIFNMPLNSGGAQVKYKTRFFFGLSPGLFDKYGRMSHLEHTPTTASTNDLNFGECPLVTPIGGSPVNNLFNIYWKPYYDQLYDPDARIVKLKMRLTPKDINEFEFYDTVMVKNREYRVNKIQYNSGLLASVELILIT